MRSVREGQVLPYYYSSTAEISALQKEDRYRILTALVFPPSTRCDSMFRPRILCDHRHVKGMARFIMQQANGPSVTSFRFSMPPPEERFSKPPSNGSKPKMLESFVPSSFQSQVTSPSESFLPTRRFFAMQIGGIIVSYHLWDLAKLPRNGSSSGNRLTSVSERGSSV